jgi:anthranilate synthase component 1
MGDDFSTRFAEQYEAGKSQIVWRRIVADLETPIGTYLKLAQERTHSFLLESVQDGTTRGRYSIIGLLPDLIVRVEDGTASVNRQAQLDPDAFEVMDAKPLDALRGLVAESQIEVPPGLPPQSAGIYGYLGYEMVRYMEVLPNGNPDDLKTPEAVLMRPSLLAIFDTVKDELYLTAPVYVKAGVSARQALEAAEARIDDAIARLGRALPATPALPDLESIEVTSNTSRDEYFEMVARAKDYIAAGDIFQVV